MVSKASHSTVARRAPPATPMTQRMAGSYRPLRPAGTADCQTGALAAGAPDGNPHPRLLPLDHELRRARRRRRELERERLYGLVQPLHAHRAAAHVLRAHLLVDG